MSYRVGSLQDTEDIVADTFLLTADSLVNIAKAQDVEAAKVRESIVNSFKRQLDEAVKAGKMTQTQADETYSTGMNIADSFIASVPD